MNAYRADKDRHPHGDTVWLLHNKEPFSLQQIYDGEITSFQTDIKRLVNGDYPADPFVIKDVEVKLERTLYFRPFNPQEGYQEGIFNRYIVFSSDGAEVFLSHYLTKDPDYDLLASMRWVKSESMPLVPLPYAVPYSIWSGHEDGPSAPERCPLVAGNLYMTVEDVEGGPPDSDHLGTGHRGSHSGHTKEPSIGVNSISWYDPTSINGKG